MGLMGLKWRKGGAARAGRAPPQGLVRIGLGGGAAPLPCFLLLLHGRTPSWTRKEGILLPVGVGLLLARPPPGRPHPPLILYIRSQGAPLDTQVDPRDHILSRVRCPLPP